MNEFLKFRNKYNNFIYDKYDISYDEENMIIKFFFSIEGLEEFTPSIKINKKYIKNKNINKNMLNYLVFHIGLIEMISYYKATCCTNIIINAGYVNADQIKWFKKILFNGLGEFLYKNNITVTEDELVNIICNGKEVNIDDPNYEGTGNLISIGGGKDSCVSLEILKNEKNNSAFIINAKTPSLECARIAGYSNDNIICVERILDRKIIDLNNRGFLNGHTPFSALVAFISYLCAYLNNKRYIVLSNESSANESTVIGTNINHQYSKSFEFENDFYEYTHKYFRLEIDYFSLLRGISEFQIGRIFSRFTKYHKVFKSCNLGSKEKEWKWCCNCSKCLFVYMILSPFLYKEDLVNIFGEDLYEREDLLDTFKEIIGETEVKPFDCVGTIEEAKYSVSLLIDKLDKDKLPFLLDYYYENYDLELDGSNILKYNEENNIPKEYEKLVKEVLDNER
ncbi:MAG: hypothetical protein IKQ35_01590 [Bacilli bacterium]|nr:hypothetical protein [Bacilli bacterium]